MAKYTGYQFHQVMRDLDGNVIYRKVYPTRAEVEVAKKSGEQMIEIKEVQLTPVDAIKEALRADLSKKNQMGVIVEPDIHEDVKFELYELARKIINIGNTDEEVSLDSSEIAMIKLRAKRILSVDAYGFLHELLEGKRTDFKVVRQDNGVASAAEYGVIQ